MLLSYGRIISDSCQLGERLIRTFVMPLLLGWVAHWVDKNSFCSPSFSLPLLLSLQLSLFLFPVSSVCYQRFDCQVEAQDILESFRVAMEVLTAAHNLLPAAVSLMFAFWLQRDVVWWFSCLSGANTCVCVCVRLWAYWFMYGSCVDGEEKGFVGIYNVIPGQNVIVSTWRYIMTLSCI